MKTGYQNEHYEDVARIVSWHTTAAKVDGDKKRMAELGYLCLHFADLFAADRPPSSRCWTCGNSEEAGSTCTRLDGKHRFGGFDREQFLAACGVERRES